MKTKESAARGQTIVTSTGPDKSSHKVNAKEALGGREMKDMGLQHTLNPDKFYNTASKKGNIPL